MSCRALRPGAEPAAPHPERRARTGSLPPRPPPVPSLIKAMALILAGALSSNFALAYDSDKLLPLGVVLLFSGFSLIARLAKNAGRR